MLAAYVTLVYGDGGVAKSLLALALAVAVAGGSDTWLGRRVENGPVLYVDFELDAEEQAKRVRQLCRTAGRDQEPPEDLLYMSAVGYRARDVFNAARKACEEHGVVMVVLDSYGVALGGDAEASKDVIAFNNEVLEPFRALKVAVVIIDHQSKLQAGQSYQQKGAFGSVFKSNLARSVIQVEATERGENTLTVRLRQKKHNFGPLAEPFAVKIAFSEESVDLAFYRQAERPVAPESETALTLTLENGSRIVSLPGKEGTVRGYSGVRLMVIDEAARVPDELYASVRPMLAVSTGRLVALSTPFGTRGWWCEAWRSWEAWERYEVPATDVPRISPEFLEEERRTLGEWWFEQEYMCAFLDAETQAFRREDIDRTFDEEVEPWKL